LATFLACLITKQPRGNTRIWPDKRVSVRRLYELFVRDTASNSQFIPR
jgi:hypothetical protein